MLRPPAPASLVQILNSAKHSTEAKDSQVHGLKYILQHACTFYTNLAVQPLLSPGPALQHEPYEHRPRPEAQQ